MGFFEPETVETKETPKGAEVKNETGEQPSQPVANVEVTEELSTEAQLVQLAKDNKTTVADLQTKLKKIMDEQKLKERGAMAVLKSELTGFQRTTQSKEFIARVIAIEADREFQSNRAGGNPTYRASSMEFITMEDGKPIGVSLRPTDKNADIYKKFWPLGDVFKFTCGYFTDRNTKALRLTVPDEGIGEVTRLKADDPLAKAVPTFQEIAKSRVQHLNQLNKYVKQTAVFSGVISRHITRQDGTYMGIEVSDGTVFKTVPCFLAEPLLSAMNNKRIPIGTEVWLYGYVGSNADTGEPRLAPRGIYPPA